GNTKNLIVYLEDILYWIIVAFIIIVSAFVTNNGELRGYMFIGYMIGAIFYLILFSNLLLKVFGTILDFFENLFGSIWSFFKKIASKLNFKKKNANS
ncbi:MAG: spore cortex biosynthesis protein YabQ, partial [Clostridia bacterium]|nr:spore cortex biosynthesis protein YabQ [Clostridia bacterium]